MTQIVHLDAAPNLVVFALGQVPSLNRVNKVADLVVRQAMLPPVHQTLLLLRIPVVVAYQHLQTAVMGLDLPPVATMEARTDRLQLDEWKTFMNYDQNSSKRACCAGNRLLLEFQGVSLNRQEFCWDERFCSNGEDETFV